MAHHKKRQKRSFYALRTPREQSSPQPASVPARAEDTPFCAYFGPHGEFCQEMVDLEAVFAIPGASEQADLPVLAWMACPMHREHVRQRAEIFLQRMQHTPQLLMFNYHNTLSQALVMPKRPLQN